MKIFAETSRLILRELLPSDDEGMFALDSDPDVHLYLGRKPVVHIDESRKVIETVRQQYIDYGIGRWAVIEKSSGQFIGWSGLKFCTELRNNHINYYDVGYRLIKQYWGNGFATESAVASLEYGFEKMKLPIINATADMNNLASRRVLEKCGLKHIGVYTFDGNPSAWLEMTKEEWAAKK